MNRVIAILLLINISFTVSRFSKLDRIRDLVENFSKESVNNPLFYAKYFHSNVKFIRSIFNNEKITQGRLIMMEFFRIIFQKVVKIERKKIISLISSDNVVVLELELKLSSLKRKVNVNIVAIFKFEQDKIIQYSLYTDFGNLSKNLGFDL
jgi:predicted SnoaL-like aldol condensation-catalyzing enzyme